MFEVYFDKIGLNLMRSEPFLVFFVYFSCWQEREKGKENAEKHSFL